MFSMLGYFCFLEQMLVNMGSGALVIALPFACVLGVLGSIVASTVGESVERQAAFKCLLKNLISFA